MGSALAYWLTRLDPNLGVVVIERDPTYSTASSALSAASIRQQFTTPVNIRICQASIGFLRQADELLEVDGCSVDISHLSADWRLCGVPTLSRHSWVPMLRCWTPLRSQRVSHGSEPLIWPRARSGSMAKVGSTVIPFLPHSPPRPGARASATFAAKYVGWECGTPGSSRCAGGRAVRSPSRLY
jgi:hypothetical protein